MKIYDGEGIILGRLAAVVAKDALLGEEVNVVNCEKIVISGRREVVFAHEKQKVQRGGYPYKSVNISRLPDHFVRKAIRGMLPFKKPRGQEAFRRIMCYIGVPDEFNTQSIIRLEKESAKKLPLLKKVTVGEVCRWLGGRL